MAAAGEKQGKWKGSLKEAIEDAADEFGPGDHEVTVIEIQAKVRVASPGQVREYRVKVEK
jgi:hypothetical protein